MKQRNFNNKNNQQKPVRKKVSNPDPMGTPQSMQRHAMHIFKNIAFGKWDFGLESDIFKYPNFVQNALIAVSAELNKAQIHCNAIMVAYPGSTDPAIVSLYREDCKKMQAYQLIYNVLIQVQQYGDPGFILTLVNRLPEFKYSL